MTEHKQQLIILSDLLALVFPFPPCTYIVYTAEKLKNSCSERQSFSHNTSLHLHPPSVRPPVDSAIHTLSLSYAIKPFVKSPT